MPSLTASSSLPSRLRTEWARTWSQQPVQLADGRTATASHWLTTIRSTAGVEQDGLLRLVMEAATDGECAAERALWILLIPPVDRAAPAWIVDGAPQQERPSIVAAAVWEAIRCQVTDTSRPHVFRHLVRDATALLTRAVPAERRHLDQTTEAVDPMLLIDLAGAAPVPTVPAEIRLARLLTEATAAGVVTADEVDLLRRAVLAGRTIAEVAADAGIPADTMRKRMRRITWRLSVVYAS